MSSASSLLFHGRTAIVTGAGGALGRAYAYELAKRGCQLLVNDVGGTLTGEPHTVANTVTTAERSSPAHKLAQEIVSKGGKAVANTHNVLDGAAIVDHAYKAFGSCDIIINNAGILRDKSFAKMTATDFQMVLDVHLGGTFSLCHAAWPRMQEQNYGRIVNIGSGAGLYGNFGQANYSAAKMAILGLSNTLAKEGEKYGINVNCVVPVAASRMTETVLPPDMLKLLHPKHVVPLVVYLAHEKSTHTGDCYEIGGGWYSKVRLQRSTGRFLAADSGEAASVESVASAISSITEFDLATVIHDKNILAQLQALDIDGISAGTYPTNAGDALRSVLISKESEKNPKAVAARKQTEKEEIVAAKTQKLASDEIFFAIEDYFKGNHSASLENVKARIRFNVLDKSGKVAKSWFMDTKDVQNPTIVGITEDNNESIGKPSTTISCTDEKWLLIATGSLSPEYAYMRGFMKIDGSMGNALKVKTLLALLTKEK